MTAALAVQLAGAVCEVAGVLLMANLYIGGVRLKQIVLVLLSALVRGDRARDAVAISDLISREDKLTSLQGLALIGLGFVLQAAGADLAAVH